MDDDDLERPRAVVIGGECYVTFIPDGYPTPIVIRGEKDRVENFDRKRRD